MAGVSVMLGDRDVLLLCKIIIVKVNNHPLYDLFAFIHSNLHIYLVESISK